MKKKCLVVVWLSVFLFLGMVRPAAQEKLLSVPSGRVEVKAVIRLIEEQTSYTMAYNHADLNVNRTVEITESPLSIDQLLRLLLADTGCTYLIREKHILIRKYEEEVSLPVPDLPKAVVQEAIAVEKQEYTGRVFDAKSHTPLAYATVVLLDHNQQPVTAGVTDDKGLFRLQANAAVSWLRISFIGYKPFEQSLPEVGKDLGIFYMEEDETQLQQVTVTASGVNYQVDRNVYVVTDEMRAKSSDAQELLDHIHGVRVDKVTNTIKVGNETAVLLLVDGMQQSQQYIKNLAPERIQRVEVVNEPTGRFLSEGYGAIINYVLKRNYTGHDLLVRNFTIASPSGANGDDWLMNEQPMVNFTYTRNRVSLYGTFVYGRSRWNTPVERYVQYGESMALQSEAVSTDNPNDRYKYTGNYATIGINYHLTDDHILSAQAEQTYSNVHTENQFWMKYVNGAEADPFDMGDKTLNHTKDNDWVASLFYKGQLNEKWSLYSDFSYNYYHNSIVNKYFSLYRFANDVGVSANQNEYKENKKLTSFNAEANYAISTAWTLNMGYSNVWRRYDSDSRAGENYLDYRETRDKFFLYLACSPTSRWKFKLGTALEYIRVKEKDAERKEWSLQPYLQMNYEANKQLNFQAAYTTNNYYPSLYQLSPMTTAIDTFLLQIGNPNLKSAIRHVASVRMTLWNRLTFMPSFRYTPKRISEYYTHAGEKYYRSFANIDARQYGIQAFLDQPLGKYFTLNAMGMYYYGKVKYEELSNSVRGWLLDADLNYFNPTHNLGVSLGYYRGLEKSILLQGYQNVNMDNWVLTLNKQWWDNRISLSVNYILPLSWGVRWNQWKEIDTPYFKEKVNQNLKTYENMLLVRLGFRFNSGNVKQTERKSTLQREEREQRTTPF